VLKLSTTTWRRIGGVEVYAAHRIGGWVGPRAVLNAVVKKFTAPAGTRVRVDIAFTYCMLIPFF